MIKLVEKKESISVVLCGPDEKDRELARYEKDDEQSLVKALEAIYSAGSRSRYEELQELEANIENLDRFIRHIIFNKRCPYSVQDYLMEKIAEGKVTSYPTEDEVF